MMSVSQREETAMDVDLLTWWDLVLRGGLAGAAFLLLFLAARWRWRQREVQDAQADIGLD
jgi:hypothetical protein